MTSKKQIKSNRKLTHISSIRKKYIKKTKRQRTNVKNKNKYVKKSRIHKKRTRKGGVRPQEISFEIEDIEEIPETENHFFDLSDSENPLNNTIDTDNSGETTHEDNSFDNISHNYISSDRDSELDIFLSDNDNSDQARFINHLDSLRINQNAGRKRRKL